MMRSESEHRSAEAVHGTPDRQDNVTHSITDAQVFTVMQHSATCTFSNLMQVNDEPLLLTIAWFHDL